MNYRNLSERILEHVGGKENVANAVHCATRLRISYKRRGDIDEEGLKALEGVLGVVTTPEQVQVIIGPSVGEVYAEFIEVSGVSEGAQGNDAAQAEPQEKNLMYYLTKFGNASAAVFMPIIPALITGGLILAIKNMLVNYGGMATDNGTVLVFDAIYSSAFSFLPVYIGYTLSRVLKLEPILGAFLGAILVSSSVSGVEGLEFLGLQIPVMDYNSTVLPIVLGVALMYWVDKALNKIIPEVLKLSIKPLLTMVIVVPITLLWLGPIGNLFADGLNAGVSWLTDNALVITVPLLEVINPYMVMLGLDKAYIAVETTFVAQLGWSPVIIGYISNLCIGGTALAVATSIHDDVAKRGMVFSFGATALCGVTEPAFYGALLERPKALLGTAIGATVAGIVAGIFVLKEYAVGICPGLLTFPLFIAPDGSLGNLILAVVVAAIAISVSFVATKIILMRTAEK